MFSGIVETQARVVRSERDRGLVRIAVERPAEFDDLGLGDSVCTNGVCLTIETLSDDAITFALGAETLKITGWDESQLLGATVNLERSMKMGDRNHGHVVTGHVDATGRVVSIEDLGGSVQVNVQAPESVLRYVWRKGSWAINGVSLTVNSVEGDVVSVCLIPETLKRTNLGAIKAGDQVNLEVDPMARGVAQLVEQYLQARKVSQEQEKE